MDRRFPLPIEDSGTLPLKVTEPSMDLDEWRWRSYADHLSDLGYDLASGSATDDDLSGAVERYVGRLSESR
jgi:hypothetical protein